MCGICGILDFNKSGSVDPNSIKRMCDELRHRGPDDEGLYSNGRIGLGIRRLSVIDLVTGHQPVHNEDKKIWVVMNGEIYNFRDLRDGLEGKGHKFYTKSDTEVLVHLYEEYGENCVQHLRGMYAFAIWDERRDKLTLARDRVGKKPLCYRLENGRMVFGSEIKSILAVSGTSPRMDPEALDLYLTYKYIPAPKTIFQGIRKLPPASILVWEDGKMTINEYWDLKFTPKGDFTEAEWEERIMERLREAVKIRLVSDVPLGVLLSGGVDSSAVTALASQLSGGPVKTFSAGFEEADFSELEYARLIAKRFNTEHREFIVKPEAAEILPELISHYGEPFADASCIPTFYLAKLSREFVTVALSGDGGDENFAGYGWYNIHSYFAPFNAFPRFLFALNDSLFKAMGFARSRSVLLRRLKKAMKYGRLDPVQRYGEWVSYFNEELKSQLYNERLKKGSRKEREYGLLLECLKGAGDLGVLDKHLYVDIKNYLPGDLLVKMDIASMANSLEVRSPFLDHKFLEFTATIPAGLKLKRGEGKYIFKKAMEGLLPEEILNRKKQGFSVPLKKWIGKDLSGFIERTLLSKESAVGEYFNTGFIKQMLTDHRNGSVNYAGHLWALTNFEIWHKIFIEKKDYAG
ncbi:MAG: asparagine synthase (glutamine-hydrolyzing) [Candidatus Omnitrophica bacterium]|nr:asparagine synthase (glutamine-hydrolyzing) [Candidatus Omnitrophota bacterium]